MGAPRNAGQEVQSTAMSPGQFIDVAHAGASIVSAGFYPVTRVGMGVRALRWLGPVAFLMLIVLAETCHCLLMYAWLCLWVVACFVQAFLRDRNQMSTYAGFPVVAKILHISEQKGRVLEAILIMALGVALRQEDAHISTFFIAGGFCLLMRDAIERSVQQRRVMEMRDAAIANQMAAQMYEERW